MIEEDSERERQRRLRAAQQVVIKVGASIMSRAGGGVCAEHIEPLVRSIAELKRAGRQVVLVSSVAVGLGAGRLGLHPSRLHDVVVRQACAAVGQSLLMPLTSSCFACMTCGSRRYCISGRAELAAETRSQRVNLLESV